MTRIACTRAGPLATIATLLVGAACAWTHGALAAGPPARQGSAPLYSCQDERGQTLVSDRPIAECANRPLRVLRQDGLIRRELPAPLSAEQRRRQELGERQRQVEVRAQREVQARDRALLQAYPDAAALEVVRQRQLADIDEDIGAAAQRLAALRETQRELLPQAGEDPARAPLPLRQRLSDLSNGILAETAFVARRAAEREQIAQRFAEDSARLTTLLGATVATAGRTAPASAPATPGH